MRFNCWQGVSKTTKKKTNTTKRSTLRKNPRRIFSRVSFSVVFEENALRGRIFQGEKAPIRPGKKSGLVIMMVERIGKSE